MPFFGAEGFLALLRAREGSGCQLLLLREFANACDCCEGCNVFDTAGTAATRAAAGAATRT